MNEELLIVGKLGCVQILLALSVFTLSFREMWPMPRLYVWGFAAIMAAEGALNIRSALTERTLGSVASVAIDIGLMILCGIAILKLTVFRTVTTQRP
jgi:hypothetical protein